MDTTSTTSPPKFFGMDIDSPFTWPGYPRVPTVDSNLQPLDLTRPIQYQSTPRYYYKWLRVMPSSGSRGTGWVKFLYLPPGTETPITLDKAVTNDFEAVSAWCLFISRPDCQDCKISTYAVSTPLVVQTSTLQRAQVVELVNCQTADFPEASPDGSQLIEEWSMSQGSALLDSGNVYFKVANTGTQTQTLVSLGSFDQYDLKDILTSPMITTHRPFFLNWVNNPS